VGDADGRAKVAARARRRSREATLAGRHDGQRTVAEALDLGADVGLGVEPGPGHPGGAGECLESHQEAGAVEFAQRFQGLWRG
jgi:hypothetical protein